MKCKVCGAQNDDYLEYCENCAAPLNTGADTPKTHAANTPRTSAANEQGPAFGFVRSPKWPKPEFNANTVNEEEIPKEYVNRFNPRKVEQTERAKQAESTQRYSIPDVSRAEQTNDDDITIAAPSNFRQSRQPVNKAAQYREEPIAEDNEPVHFDDEDYGDDEYDDEVDNTGKKIKYAEPLPEDEYFDYDDEAPRKKKSKFSFKNRNFIFAAAAALLVVIIIVLAIVFVNKNYGGSFSNFFSSVFGGNPITQEPTIEATTTDDGAEAYLITVYTKPNYTVRFTAGSFVREVAVKSDGSLPLRIPMNVWIPDEPLTESQLVVKPDIVLIAPDGTETPLEFAESITIDIPTIELNVTAPTTTELNVDSPDVSIAGNVVDNTVMLFIDDVQISVDESGNFSSSYTLPGAGTYTVNIEARKNGYQIVQKSYTITYADPSASAGTDTPGNTTDTPLVSGNIAIDFDEGLTRRSTDSTMTVSGTMDPAATISVSGVEVDGEVTTDSANGKFSFKVKTADVGLYPVTVTATKDNAASAKTIYLEHNPDKDSYISGAYKLDYDRIKSEPNHKQGYKVVGTIAEIIQAEPYVIARITTSAGDIIFSYYSGITSVATDDGKTYEVYADPAGTDSSTGLPHMYVWFILKSSH